VNTPPAGHRALVKDQVNRCSASKGRAGEREDQAEDAQLHGQRPVPARSGELRQHRQEDQQALGIEATDADALDERGPIGPGHRALREAMPGGPEKRSHPEPQQRTRWA